MTRRHWSLTLVTIALAVILVIGYRATATSVTVSVDGQTISVHSHCQTVAELLAQMGIGLAPQDIVVPSPTTPLTSGLAVRVQRARRVAVVADGLSRVLHSHAVTVADVLREAGLTLHSRDLIYTDGKLAPDAATLLAPPQGVSQVSYMAQDIMQPTVGGHSLKRRSQATQRPAPVTVSVVRAVAVTIIQDGTSSTVMTTASSVGEALFSEGIYVYAADVVVPVLNTPVSAGMTIQIRRATPVTITADGRTFSTRTQARTVSTVLADEGVAPQGKDYTLPALDTPVTAGLAVRVVRIREEILTESEGIAFKTVWQPDATMELDQRRVVTQGKQGIRKRTIRVVYQDGKEIHRVLDREWVDQEPVTHVIAYGTRVVVRTMQTPDGPIEYWRMLRVWATYYTAATSGKHRGHPQYGITRTGRWATKGIIAVDPRYIRLHTPMYVPGYGFGAAEDTGGLILGMHIDLCYDEDDPFPRHLGWVTIYLLTPVPPASDIPYVMADFPSERR